MSIGGPLRASPTMLHSDRGIGRRPPADVHHGRQRTAVVFGSLVTVVFWTALGKEPPGE